MSAQAEVPSERRADTPTRFGGLPVGPWWPDQLECCRTWLAAEHLSPPARERVPLKGACPRLVYRMSLLRSEDWNGPSPPTGSPLPSRKTSIGPLWPAA